MDENTQSTQAPAKKSFMHVKTKAEQELDTKIAEEEHKFAAAKQALMNEAKATDLKATREITTKVGNIGREFKELRVKLGQQKVSKRKQIEADFDIDLRAAQSKRDKAFKQLDVEHEAAKEESRSKESSLLNPLDVELREAKGKVEAELEKATRELTQAHVRLMEPLMAEKQRFAEKAKLAKEKFEAAQKAESETKPSEA
jgi:hypothetical protein